MKIMITHFGPGPHTELEFMASCRTTHKMGTHRTQIPPVIVAFGLLAIFEIPDSFMRDELGILEDPVDWYHKADTKAWKIKNESEQCKEVNALFAKFMNAVAKFCNYDREAAMNALY